MKEKAEFTFEQPTTSVLSNDVDRAISSKSKWGDEKWLLDYHLPGRLQTSNQINWAQKLSDDIFLTDHQHSFLLNVCKQFIWSLYSDPPAGKNRIDLSSLPKTARTLFTLVRWMLSNGYTLFSQLDEPAIGRYVLHCRNRPGMKGKTITPGSLHCYLVLVDMLYAQRNKLPDAIKVHPFGGELASVVVGDLLAERGEIPRIPDELAIAIIHKALIWVEEYAEDILAARDLRKKAYTEVIERGVGRKQASKVSKEALKEFIPSTSLAADPKFHNFFPGYHPLMQAIDLLSIACFICIAGLVGMRVSEILSLEEGCIQVDYANDGKTELIYLCGRTFKTEPEPTGKATRWIAPPPVKTAIRILESLSLPLREIMGLSYLFYSGIGRQGATHLLSTANTQAINRLINQFADFVGVPLYNGEVWRFSSHQFRKTFARFVGKQDKTGLHALSQHFKHVSMAMTDSYVGKDFELYELVEESRSDETVQALDSILAADCLAGKMGEEILTRNHKFRGRAGEELRKDYIKFILSEADLTIISHEFALCVFQPEVALCSGDRAKMGRELCVKCPNFVVSELHRPFWEDDKNRNLKILELLENRPALIQGPVKANIEQADRILLQLNKRNGEH
jgi:integrase